MFVIIRANSQIKEEEEAGIRTKRIKIEAHVNRMVSISLQECDIMTTLSGKNTYGILLLCS
jgi:hypothetical protein